MKIDSKHVIPFLETLRALFEDLQAGFNECEDRYQCLDVLNYTLDDVYRVITTFKVEHLTPIVKVNKKSEPTFIRHFDKVMILTSYGRNPEKYKMDSNDETHVFMGLFYYAIKKKLRTDGVDHLHTRKKVEYHIYHYLVVPDDKWNYYFDTELKDAAWQVIYTVIDEIFNYRKKNPQMVMQLDAPQPEPEPENNKIKLIDLL